MGMCRADATARAEDDADVAALAAAQREAAAEAEEDHMV